MLPASGNHIYIYLDYAGSSRVYFAVARSGEARNYKVGSTITYSLRVPTPAYFVVATACFVTHVRRHVVEEHDVLDRTVLSKNATFSIESNGRTFSAFLIPTSKDYVVFWFEKNDPKEYKHT